MAAKALLLVLLARICFGETGFEITLPAGVASETFSGRYLLTGSFGGLGGWLEPKKDVESYRVETVVEGQPATRIKAVLYAPGCALQTFDGMAPGFAFRCEPLPTVAFQGKLTRSDAL